MPVPRITSEQFDALISADINARNSQFDTTMGPIKDTVIRPVSRVFEAQNERIRYVFQLLSFQRPNELNPNDVDAFTFTEQVIRSAGTAGFTDLVFFRRTAPLTDYTVPVGFPVATQNDPTTGVSITYVTLQPQTMFAATAGAYFNGTTNRYELRVPSASVTVGSGTAVGTGTLIRPLRPLVGFDGVTNDGEVRGGLPAESNSDVANRYFKRIQGTEIGTPAGLDRYVRQNFGNVEDLNIIYGNNPTLTRANTDAGAVDVYVLGQSLLSRTNVLPFPGRLVKMFLDRDPVVSIVLVSSGANFTEGIDFEFVPDTGINQGSTRAQDAIRFLATGGAPAIGAPVTISFLYDSLIVALQSFFTTSEYYETGRDALFKRGILVNIALQGQLTVNAGNPPDVLTVVTQTILDFINGGPVTPGYKLGQDVEEFDITAVISRIPGVDNFVYTLLAPVGQTGVNDIPIADNEYARLSPSNLAITLT